MLRHRRCTCVLATLLQSFHIEMGSCLCKEKARRNHDSNSSRGSRSCRRTEDRNRSPQSIEQEVDFENGED
ncbi:hypothetical protein Y032_0041g352 [Ancylostoma ceylanicum]|uniref:Secreted protein n=1 Tax=Ancylostoma ceylanicum TaxID=53326 RepID=A0A016UG43_9BILA|nr:hypothetical protein Y032_0041g352 [Ancylostoma ceylanicum]